MAEIADEGGVEGVTQSAKFFLLAQQYVVAQAVVQVVQLLPQCVHVAEERSAVQFLGGVGEDMVRGLGLLVVLVDGLLQRHCLLHQAVVEGFFLGDKVDGLMGSLEALVHPLDARLEVQPRPEAFAGQQRGFGIVPGLLQCLAAVGEVAQFFAAGSELLLQLPLAFVLLALCFLQGLVALLRLCKLLFQIPVLAEIEVLQCAFHFP